MAASLVAVLNSLESKISELIESRTQLKTQVAFLEEENRQLKSQLLEKDNRINSLSNDLEFLTMSHKLADNPDALIATRRKIARLIRTIDTCISMIKEE